jgi:hypothetical protein
MLVTIYRTAQCNCSEDGGTTSELLLLMCQNTRCFCFEVGGSVHLRNVGADLPDYSTGNLNSWPI